MQMRVRNLVCPVSARRQTIQQVKRKPLFQRSEGRAGRPIASARFIKVSHDHPALLPRIVKTHFDDLANRARLGLTYDIRLLGIRIRRFEMANKQRDTCKTQLKTIPPEKAVIPEFAR